MDIGILFGFVRFEGFCGKEGVGCRLWLVMFGCVFFEYIVVFFWKVYVIFGRCFIEGMLFGLFGGCL